MFGDQGNYSDTNGRDAGEGMEGAELRLDPSKVQGLKDYQPGDKVTITIEATMGDPDDSGFADFQITHASAEPMPVGAKSTRNMMGRKPDMSGTALQDNSDSAE